MLSKQNTFLGDSQNDTPFINFDQKDEAQIVEEIMQKGTPGKKELV